MIHSSCFNVSSHNELINTIFVVPVTILALSIWIISVSCFLAVQLSLTTNPYSRVGLTKDV